jgi:hypothetical protein
MKFYLGHVEYYATGEGLQHYIYATSAEDRVEFIKMFAEEHDLDAYMLQGLDIYEDELPNNIAKCLPEYVASAVKEYMANGADCMFVYSSRFYVNYS